jgi:hypothetical protein
MKSKLSIWGIIIAVLLLISLTLVSAELKQFQVRETDLVKIVPQAYDPNNDNLTYYFTPPLNDNGEWQTNYGDAGEYFINITASDGQSQTAQRVLLTVLKKNRAPVLMEKKIVVKETQLIDLKGLVVDPDGDVLSYAFNAPFDRNGIWQTNYGDAGYYVANFATSDGEVNTPARVEINVLPTNPGPQINNSFSVSELVEVKEGEHLNFWVEASSKNKLSYSWTLDGKVISTSFSGSYLFNYTSSGEHLLHLAVDDGEKNIQKTWLINVSEVKRKPELNLNKIILVEGDKVDLELPFVDQDGNSLTYTFRVPLDERGEWQTDYNSSGEYLTEITASNGVESTTALQEIKVINVDREAEWNVPDKIYVKEGEELRLKVEANDPDGDMLNITFDGLPDGASFNKTTQTLTWTPSYDIIQRNPTFFNNLLSTFRLEKYFLQKKNIPLNLSVCDSSICKSKTLTLVVENMNRAPYFVTFNPVNITETETALAKVEAIDPDEDIVKYYYTDPLGRRNGKWKTYFGDKGDYVSYVTASDSSLATTQPLKIHINKNNRVPSLSVRNDDLVVNEQQQFMFHVSAGDLDKDNVSIRLDNPPKGASFKDGDFLWTPSSDVVLNKSDGWWNNLIDGENYLNKKFKRDEKSVVWLNFIASDGESETSHPVKVTVVNVNRAPVVLDSLPEEEVTVPLNVPVNFHLFVKDGDGDNLTYTWEFSGWRERKLVAGDTLERTFTALGDKTVKVSVDDGRDQIVKEWKVHVVEGDQITQQSIIGTPTAQDPFTIRVYVIEGNKSTLLS